MRRLKRALLRVAIGAVRRVAKVLGLVKRYSVIIYKVDRSGDWLLGERAIERVVREEGGASNVLVWASIESAQIRKWRGFLPRTEEIRVAPVKFWERFVNVLRMAKILSVSRADKLICLRHSSCFERDIMVFSADVARRYYIDYDYGAGPRNEAGGLDVGNMNGGDKIPLEILRHGKVLNDAGYLLDDARGLLPAIESAQTLGERRVIVLCPFGMSEIRDWPITSWRRLITLLAAPDSAFEVWVSEDQLSRGEAFARKLKEGDAAGQINVRSGPMDQFARALVDARLVVSVETLSAHLATALDARLVGLLGGGHFGEFAPWKRSERQQWVNRRLPCYNCDWICSRRNIDCIVEIEPEEVYRAALRSIEGN